MDAPYLQPLVGLHAGGSVPLGHSARMALFVALDCRASTDCSAADRRTCDSTLG